MTFHQLYGVQTEEPIHMDEQIDSRPDVRKLATVKHPNGTILVGDCRDGMRTLPEKSVHCVVTSPPYWGLRDYQVSGQIGLEKSMDEFLSAMVGVFQEVRRVLRDDGVCWVNMGDSYAGGGRGGNPDESPHRKQATNTGSVTGKAKDRGIVPDGLKPKDLCGMPWRLAFALQADGWYLRQDVIWHKPNPMPESVSDRCTKSHEYVFLLTKRARYWYDAEGIKVEQSPETEGRYEYSFAGNKREAIREQGIRIRGNENSFELGQKANKRSVWTVPTQGYPGAHFATYPQKLIEPCIIAGCPEQCCHSCGTGWVRQLEKVRRPTRPGENTKIKMPDGWDTGEGGHGTFHRNGREAGETRDRAAEVPNGTMLFGNRDPERHVTETVTVGWVPACKCGNSESVPGTVLDPFGGSGTTAKVAIDLGRRFVLCELNPEYVELIKDRIEQPALF